MREIPLTRGMVALVDDTDHPMLSQLTWYARTNGHGNWYAITGRRCHMHRLILCPPVGVEIDHANGDGLDNRRANLRYATRAENSRNLQRPARRLSSFKGVHPSKSGKWFARVNFEHQVIHLGSFVLEEDAARAYDAAALRYFGEFARLNFPIEMVGR